MRPPSAREKAWAYASRINSIEIGPAVLKRGIWKAFAGPFCGKNKADDAAKDRKGKPDDAPAVIAAEDGGDDATEDRNEDLLVGHDQCSDLPDSSTAHPIRR